MIVVALSVGACSKADAGAGPTLAAAAPPADPKPADLEGANSGRKVIKNAELSLTVSSASNAAREATKIAERYQGYVVSSEQNGGEEPGRTSSVRVVLRVKAEDLDRALDALKAMGKSRGNEHITSEDVTEEWIDLEARIKTQKALETQYLEILKSATKVDDMLGVQKQLAEVRGEIEKMEGRKRFLEKQVGLSTITVSLVEDAPLVSASFSAFGRALRSAAGDVVNVGAALLVGIIRLLGVLLPITLIVLVPLYFLGRMAFRRLSSVKI